MVWRKKRGTITTREKKPFADFRLRKRKVYISTALFLFARHFWRSFFVRQIKFEPIFQASSYIMFYIRNEFYFCSFYSIQNSAYLIFYCKYKIIFAFLWLTNLTSTTTANPFVTGFKQIRFFAVLQQSRGNNCSFYSFNDNFNLNLFYNIYDKKFIIFITILDLKSVIDNFFLKYSLEEPKYSFLNKFEQFCFAANTISKNRDDDKELL